MPKVSKTSKKKVPSNTKADNRTNPRGRKSKRQDEESPKTRESILRQGKHETQVLEKPFDLSKLKTGDKFKFIAPGKGKRSYTCTVQDREVLFERDDGHSYTRPFNETKDLVINWKLECVLV